MATTNKGTCQKTSNNAKAAKKLYVDFNHTKDLKVQINKRTIASNYLYALSQPSYGAKRLGFKVVQKDVPARLAT